MPSELKIAEIIHMAAQQLESHVLSSITEHRNVYRLGPDTYVTEEVWLDTFREMPRWAANAVILWENGYTSHKIAAILGEGGCQALSQAACDSIAETDAECFFTTTP
ncbi:hypothetical protein [Bifidobacterium catulorum]|uniref:hypothetical protein n=1 Tax=Bifidobacterium catulorum TaxID=1630173 RepID=UPI0011B25438|nr:hypothetical protein [Bifidobacterium catulorum]